VSSASRGAEEAAAVADAASSLPPPPVADAASSLPPPPVADAASSLPPPPVAIPLVGVEASRLFAVAGGAGDEGGGGTAEAHHTTGGAPLREHGGGSSSATPEEEPADQPATPAVPLVVLQEQAPPVSMVVLGDVEEAANAQGMTHEI
jgi:hypothetical protein